MILSSLHLKKERFPTKRKGKLMPKGDGPFKLLAKLGANAYKLVLSGHVIILATFNVGDLSPYVEHGTNFDYIFSMIGWMMNARTQNKLHKRRMVRYF